MIVTDVEFSPDTMRAPCGGEVGSLTWPSVEYHTVKEVPLRALVSQDRVIVNVHTRTGDELRFVTAAVGM